MAAQQRVALDGDEQPPGLALDGAHTRPPSGFAQQQAPRVQEQKEESEDEAIAAEMLLGLGGACEAGEQPSAVVKKRAASSPSASPLRAAKQARLVEPLGESSWSGAAHREDGGSARLHAMGKVYRTPRVPGKR